MPNNIFIGTIELKIHIEKELKAMLKAAFYERQITSPLGSVIPGALVPHYSEGVVEELYARAVSIDLDGKTVIIISLDALYAITPLCDAVIARITEYTQVPGDNIIICATHCHSGIAVPRKGVEGVVEDTAYHSVLARIIADAGIIAFQRMKPAKIKYNHSIEKGLTFNRNYIMKDGSIRTNPGWQNPDIVKPFGPVDEEFSNLFFFDENDKPIGAISNFACHNCCIEFAGYWYSADYAGYLGDRLKDEYGHDFVTVFMLGAAGDLNHINNFREVKKYERQRYIDIGEQLAKAAIKQLGSAVDVNVDKIDAVKECIPLERRGFDKGVVEEAKYLYENVSLEGMSFSITKPDSEEYKRVRAKLVMNIDELPNPLPCYVQSVRIGECVIHTVPGEYYTTYGLDIKKRSAAKYTFISTVTNNPTSNYIPVPEAYGTTIYEAQPSSAIFTKDTGWRIADVLVRQGEELMKKGE